MGAGSTGDPDSPSPKFFPPHQFLTTMMKIALTIVFASTLVLAGCATSPGGKTDAPQAAAMTPAPPRIAPSVSVPSASARKVVLAMTGPKNVVEAKDWAEFKREWRETFAEHAKAAGIAFSFAEGDPQPGSEDGTLLLVTVADYRIVGIGARIWFGIMTGNAFIDARIRFASLRDGTTFGEQQYNTTSSAGGGVFAKVTPQQVDTIASNVFMDLKASK
jgi:hypothetical protein